MTRRSFWMIMLLPALAGLALLTAFSVAPVPPGPSWGIWFDAPTNDGTHTIKIRFRYQDSTTKVHTKDVTSTVDLDVGMTAAQKKDAVQQALDAALADDVNQVNGSSLAQTSGGGGNAMTINPLDKAGVHENTKITALVTVDERTGETDSIVNGEGEALGMVYLGGELIGQTADGAPSVCSVKTNLGTVTAALSSDMTRLQVLEALSTGLRQQDPGVVTFVVSCATVIETSRAVPVRRAG